MVIKARRQHRIQRHGKRKNMIKKRKARGMIQMQLDGSIESITKMALEMNLPIEKYVFSLGKRASFKMDGNKL